MTWITLPGSTPTAAKTSISMSTCESYIRVLTNLPSGAEGSCSQVLRQVPRVEYRETHSRRMMEVPAVQAGEGTSVRSSHIRGHLKTKGVRRYEWYRGRINGRVLKVTMVDLSNRSQITAQDKQDVESKTGARRPFMTSVVISHLALAGKLEVGLFTEAVVVV